MTEEFSVKEKKIKITFLEKLSKLKSLMTLYNPEDYDADILSHRETQWLGELKQAFLDISKQALERAVEDTDEDNQKIYEKIVAEANKDCQLFIVKFERKIMTLAFQSENYVAASSQAQFSSESSRGSTCAVKKLDKAQCEVDIDADVVTEDVQSLVPELNKVDDWTEDMVRGIKRNTVVYDLDNAKLLRSEPAVVSLEAEIKFAVEQLEHTELPINPIMKLFPLEVYPKMADEIGDSISLETREEVFETDAERLKRVADPNVITRFSPDDCSHSDNEEGDPGGGLDDTMHCACAFISKTDPGVSLCNDTLLFLNQLS